MTDRDVLEKFYAVVESGGVGLHHRANKPRHKDCWQWQAGARKDVTRILLAFMPWFCERRRAKAEEALALLAEQHYIRQCEYCGEDFESYNGFQRFCSKKHQEQAWQAENKEHLKAYHREQYLRKKAATT